MSGRRPRQERLRASRVRRFRPVMQLSLRSRLRSTRLASSLRPSRVATSSWDSHLFRMTTKSPEAAAEEAVEVAEAAEVVVLLALKPLRQREATPRRLSRG